jgi:adenosine/AMP kinase
MELTSIPLEIPEGTNIIFGQTHFIKTVEDLYEIIAGSVPQARFGIAFCEASGACLIRVEGNDQELKKVATRNAQAVAAGHTFVLLLRDAFPINVLNAIKGCAEVCSIYCASANPVEVILAESSQGRGVLGVIDGFSPKGVEGPADLQWRKDLLRKIGYKIS